MRLKGKSKVWLLRYAETRLRSAMEALSMAGQPDRYVEELVDAIMDRMRRLKVVERKRKQAHARQRKADLRARRTLRGAHQVVDLAERLERSGDVDLARRLLGVVKDGK